MSVCYFQSLKSGNKGSFQWTHAEKGCHAITGPDGNTDINKLINDTSHEGDRVVVSFLLVSYGKNSKRREREIHFALLIYPIRKV